MTTPSRMLRPYMKAVWVWLIIWSTTELKWMVVTLVKILKLTFNKQIGLYCCILFVSWIFGNKVITPKFQLKSGISPCEDRETYASDRPWWRPKTVDIIQPGSHRDLELLELYYLPLRKFHPESSNKTYILLKRRSGSYFWSVNGV